MILNLGCGEDQHEDAINVDANPGVKPDVVADLNEAWPWEADSVDSIRAFHVFEHLDSVEHALRESQRVLKSGGVLVIKWPMNLNERADPDHAHTWVWDSPEYYTGARPWDVDVGLQVVDRSIELHSNYPNPWYIAHRAMLNLKHSILGDGRWAFDQPYTSGEFTVVFANGA